MRPSAGRKPLPACRLLSELVTNRAKPDLVQAVAVSERLVFDRVVTSDDGVLAPAGSPFFFAGIREWIIGKFFGVRVEGAD